MCQRHWNLKTGLTSWAVIRTLIKGGIEIRIIRPTAVVVTIIIIIKTFRFSTNIKLTNRAN